jgi:hypothetical protein
MTELALPAEHYGVVDTASKLVGLLLVAVGLEVGGATPPGFLLACCGTVLATITVFVTKQ